ncbi:MAG: hypothetical protein HYT22_02935 [Candidatus Niyogibacteria bacterium]|nr:hypothetical protein [Candidatus Niyogibacteria bacterium]
MNGDSIQPAITGDDFWKNPQNWIYIGVAVIVVIGVVAVLVSYSRPKTEAEIKAEVLNALRQSEPPSISAEDRAKVLESLRSSRPPAISESDKAKVLDALRGGTSQ